MFRVFIVRRAYSLPLLPFFGIILPLFLGMLLLLLGMLILWVVGTLALLRFLVLVAVR